MSAELVRAGGNGPVADVGCGPGWVTAILARLGLDAFGVDLSPRTIALARRTHPHLRFEVGSMLALDLADGSLGGLLACYSIIHVPWELRPKLFAEFHRVLAPGGRAVTPVRTRWRILGERVVDEWSASTARSPSLTNRPRRRAAGARRAVSSAPGR